VARVDPAAGWSWRSARSRSRAPCVVACVDDMSRGVRTSTLALVFTLVACGADPVVRDTSAPDSHAADAADATLEATDAAPEVTAPTCAPVAPASLHLVQDGRALRDGLGRRVWLRGVNAGGRAKFPPFLPFAFEPADPSARPFDEALARYLDRVRAWGMNVLRLPFTWEAVEPTRGVWDEVFLTRLDAFVAAAGERGLRVVLDMHQDVFSRWYCGDGFPRWAMADPERAPATGCEAWFTHYFQDADMQADFDRFWSNADGLMDAFEAMWTMIAERYADAPAVIGFEPINEPGWGTRDPITFPRDVLTPFYSRMIGLLQAAAPSRLVLVDATGYDGVLVATTLARPVGDGVVFAPHYYDGVALVSGDVSNAQDPVERLALWDAVGADWDVPVLLGEFGIEAHVTGAEPFLRRHWDAFDALAMHATQWEYSVTGEGWNAEAMSLVNADGSERGLVAELVRVWPEAIAGRLESFVYDAATRKAELALDGDGVSHVVAPARLYPEGLEARVVEGVACAVWDEAHGRVIVEARGPARVRLAPRAP